MDLNQISDALITLIRLGAGFRCVYCCIKLQLDEDDRGTYIKRLKNIVLFYVLAESIWQVKDIAFYYYQ